MYLYTNLNTSGIYVFKVNSINDLEEIAFYPESNNIYVSEYKDSYFRIDKLLNDKEMIITYVVTNNKHMEPVKKVIFNNISVKNSYQFIFRSNDKNDDIEYIFDNNEIINIIDSQDELNVINCK